MPASAVVGETPIGTLASPQDCAAACANHVCDFSFPPLIFHSHPYHRFASELDPRLIRLCSMDHIWRANFVCTCAVDITTRINENCGLCSLRRPKSTPSRSRLKYWSSPVVETAESSSDADKKRRCTSSVLAVALLVGSPKSRTGTRCAFLPKLPPLRPH